MLFYRLVSNHEVSGASSINSDNNTNNNNNNNNNNNIVVPPQGSKGNYWLSQEETSPQPLETNNNLSVKTPTKSIPILNVSPIDPKYIDIRNKYYWYFTDDDKNYFKEESIKLKDGNSSFTLSPQFRRNSQWSVNSNISFVQLDKDKDKEKKKKRNHLPIIIIVVFILSLVKIPTLQNRKLKNQIMMIVLLVLLILLLLQNHQICLIKKMKSNPLHIHQFGNEQLN